MKTLPLIILALALPCAAQGFSNKLFWLYFDYPAGELTNTVFRAHASTDIAVSVTNWTAVGSDWITDGVTNDLATLISSNKVLATAPVQFFAVSASNEWGIVFSDVLATRPPRQNVQLRLR